MNLIGWIACNTEHWMRGILPRTPHPYIPWLSVIKFGVPIAWQVAKVPCCYNLYKFFNKVTVSAARCRGHPARNFYIAGPKQFVSKINVCDAELPQRRWIRARRMRLIMKTVAIISTIIADAGTSMTAEIKSPATQQTAEITTEKRIRGPKR